MCVVSLFACTYAFVYVRASLCVCTRLNESLLEGVKLGNRPIVFKRDVDDVDKESLALFFSDFPAL